LDRRRHSTCGGAVLTNETEAEPNCGQDDYDHDVAVARLAKRRRKADQLFRFKEKQRRQRRWVPLRAAVDWLAEINERGDRCAPTEALALRRATEICALIRGDVLFPKYKLGGNDLPWCLIEDADPDNAISRFTALDLACASINPKKLRATVKKLWLPPSLLLLLFQEKRWPVPPGLNEPAKPVVEPKRLSKKAKAEIFQKWRIHRGDNVPTEDEDYAYMKTFGVSRDTVRELRKANPTRPRGGGRRTP
jgi:hypothetical protein